MKKFLLSSVAASVISSSSMAADLPSIKSAPTSPPAKMWTGFYAGLNAGYGFGISSNAQNNGWANPSYFQNSVSTAAYAGANSWMGRGIVQNGFSGGAQAGYNYQLLNSLLIGLETDIQGAGIRGTGDANGLAPSSPTSYSRNNNTLQAGIDWMGTVRGRLGYLITPSTMVYATGGLAYGEAYLNTFPLTAGDTFTGLLQGVYGSGFLTTQNSKRSVLAGWTAGAGAEWMFTPNWSLKGEALFYDLGNQAVNNTQYSGYAQEAGINPVGGSLTRAYYNGVIARLGLNYHFLANTLLEGPGFLQNPDAKNAISQNTSSSTWSGIYAGLNSGYAFGTSNNASNNGWGNPGQGPVGAAAWAGANSWMGRGIFQNGFIGGGQFGFNYQFSPNFVAGLETDMQGAGIRGTGNANGFAPTYQDAFSIVNANRTINIPAGITTIVNNQIIQSGIDWMGTTRGRIGYVVTPTSLVYATGGVAYGGAFLNTFITPQQFYQGSNAVSSLALSTQNSVRNVLVGWTAGAGAEWMFMPKWSIKGEALFYDLGSQSVTNLQYLGYAILANLNPYGGSTTRSYYNGVITRAGVNYHFSLASAPVGAKF